MQTTSRSKKTHDYVFKAKKGLARDIVVQISEQKNEPGWITDFRLKALDIFEQLPLPSWCTLKDLDLQDICYYLKPLEKKHTSWADIPDSIKNTFNALGIPQAEQLFLSGVGAQYESEMIYRQLQEKWQQAGVIFLDIETAMVEHAELVKRHFATVVQPHDNKFAALNSAVFSGGNFIYVPKNVRVELPVQAYFRMNSDRMGQFERTLIIADEGSFIHYIEGCSAPVYRTASLHSAVVEVVACAGSHVRYTTIQNWSNNVYNLVTKRAVAHRKSHMEWVDGNFGSRLTVKYPSIVLKEPEAKGSIISVAVASKGQHQDTGGKIIHQAPHTSSTILSKSISKGGGSAIYRGLVKVDKGAHHVKSHVSCSALLCDDQSRADAFPCIDVRERDADVGHEASVSALDDAQLFYVMSRGLRKEAAKTMIINGFIDAFVRELPMEYAVEINRLIALEMEDSIG
jgi:Fe-S cluster assembly protein SufB